MARVLILLALLLAALAGRPAEAQLAGCGPARVNAQTGTSYTVLNADNCKLITLSNAGAIAVTLPAAGSGSNFNAGWQATLLNIGAGQVTITLGGGTLDGSGGSYTLQQFQAVQIVSSGSAWFTRGRVPSLAANGLVDPDQLPVATVSVSGAVRAGNCLEMGGTGNRVLSISTNCRTVAIPFIIDGGGVAITTGTKGTIDVPFPCTITGVKVRLDQSGSIVVDIWKAAFSTSANPTVANTITASAKPTVSSTIASDDTTLTGWTTALSAGDVLRYNVDSASTATRATVALTCVKS